MMFSMSGKIRVLNEQTINEIAAGEVIENPASVVKELVENAIDAGSTEITIEIRGGGRQLIRITDNGCGMIPDDAMLCLERHATSKIRSSHDIFSIGTLGFRGEAVPSIAAISKFTLLTAPREATNAEGSLILVDGGKVISSGPAAREPGTTFEIKQLFFNVPVRKKFQRSPVYDAQEIEKLCIAFALAHPHIQFHLISNEESILRTEICQGENPLKQRIEALLGRELALQMRPVEASLDAFTLKGYVGLPSLHRPNRTGQYLFINGRNVISPWISHIVKESFGTMLPTGRHPLFILTLTIPSNCVDVNVHPQKREVRFSQDLNIKELVHSALNPILHPITAVERNESIPLPSPPSWKSPLWQHPVLEEEKEELKLPTLPRSKPVEENLPKVLPWDDDEEPIFITKEAPKPIQTALPLPQQPIPLLVATLNGYLLVDGNSIKGTTLHLEKNEDCAFALIDQRRAHHRVIYDQCLNQKETLPIQPLLIPHPLQLSSVESRIIAEHHTLLKQSGISLQQIGPQSWAVEAIPQVLGAISIQELVENLLILFQENKPDLLQPAIASKLADLASKSAIARSEKISLEEGKALLKQLCACAQPHFCPQGKPTVLALTHLELQKRFS